LSGCSFKPDDPVYFRDENGRALIFHGVNDSACAKDYSGLVCIEKEDIEREASYGFNLVRYLIQWKNVEPEKGMFNDAYLDAIEVIFDYRR